MQTETDELLNLLKYTEPLFLRSTPLGSYVYKNKLCYKHATPKGSNNFMFAINTLHATCFIVGDVTCYISTFVRTINYNIFHITAKS